MITHRHLVLAFWTLISPVFAYSNWDGLLQERDRILHEDIKKHRSENYTIRELGLLWQQAINQQDDGGCKAFFNDKKHFAYSANNLTELVRAEITNLIKSNSVYASWNPDEIGVLDLSQSDDAPQSIKILSHIFPLCIGPIPSEDSMHSLPEDEDIPFLRNRFPMAKHILFFDPRFFPTLDSLKAGLGHEIAHLTQSYCKGFGENTSFAIRRLAEIDADIKNICIKNVNGLWILRKNSTQIINDFCLWLDADHKINKRCLRRLLTCNLTGKEKERGAELFTTMFGLGNRSHPIPKQRRFIMTEFIEIMEDLGGAVNDEEFNAIVGLIATWNCLEWNLGLNSEFLKLVNLERTTQLPRIATCTKIPKINVNHTT